MKFAHGFVVTKMQLTFTLVLILILSITGATYAYFGITHSSSNTITGDMATVDLRLSVSRVFPVTGANSTNVLVPQLSSNSALGSALKGGCVDANSNVVCHVYEVIVENISGSSMQVVSGKLSFFGDASGQQDIINVMPNLKWRLVQSVDKISSSNSILGNYSKVGASGTGSNFVDDLMMSTNSRFVYYIIVWIEEIGRDQYSQDGNSRFFGKVEVNSSNGTGVTADFELYSQAN